jgi:hypothetical protein
MRSLLLVSIAFLLTGCAYMKSSEQRTGSNDAAENKTTTTTKYGGVLFPLGLAGFGYVVKKPE